MRDGIRSFWILIFQGEDIEVRQETKAREVFMFQRAGNVYLKRGARASMMFYQVVRKYSLFTNISLQGGMSGLANDAYATLLELFESLSAMSSSLSLFGPAHDTVGLLLRSNVELGEEKT
jgi:hypothetical protein